MPSCKIKEVLGLGGQPFPGSTGSVSENCLHVFTGVVKEAWGYDFLT